MLRYLIETLPDNILNLIVDTFTVTINPDTIIHLAHTHPLTKDEKIHLVVKELTIILDTLRFDPSTGSIIHILNLKDYDSFKL